uniref:Uncharacterized protein n=1 Tax=Ditylenchus dipsaci TaxID=166011 RepID=A0A915D355_9BILA
MGGMGVLPDEKWVTWTGYVNDCPQVYAKSLESQLDSNGMLVYPSPIRRMSPGFGVVKNGWFSPSDDLNIDLTNQQHYHMVYEANFHGTSFKEQCKDWKNPCIGTNICDQVLHGSYSLSDGLKQTITEICKAGEFLSYYELVPSLDLFLVDKFGTVLQKLTGDDEQSTPLLEVTAATESHKPPMPYIGDLTLSWQHWDKGLQAAKDGPKIPYLKIIHSGKCEEGICLHEQLVHSRELKKMEPSAKIRIKGVGENFHGFFGGATFPQKYNGELVFHGHMILKNDSTNLNKLENLIEHNLFPTHGSHIYMLLTLGERYADKENKKKIHKLSDDSNPNITGRVWPSFVGHDYLLDKVLYTAITSDGARQIRALDICTKQDILISTSDLKITNMMAVTNIHGNKILFVSDRASKRRHGQSATGLSIFIADLKMGDKSDPELKQGFSDAFWHKSRLTEEKAFSSKDKAKKESKKKRNVRPGKEEEVVHTPLFKKYKTVDFGGIHSHPRFSNDGQKLIFQASGGHYGTDCLQTYEMDLTAEWPGQTIRRLSSGFGRSEPSAFYGANDQFRLISSNFLDMTINWTNIKLCPPLYCDAEHPLSIDVFRICNHPQVWEIFDNMHLYKVDQFGVQQPLDDNTDREKCGWMDTLYQSEATFSEGSRDMVYVIRRNENNTELYKIENFNETQNLCSLSGQQVTSSVAYKGSPSFSSDGKWVVFEGQFPSEEQEEQTYKRLLNKSLVLPGHKMEIFVARAKSTMASSDLFLKRKKDIVQVTYAPRDNSFDYHGRLLKTCFGGKTDNCSTKLVWASSRNNTCKEEINLFLADWVYNGK